MLSISDNAKLKDAANGSPTNVYQPADLPADVPVRVNSLLSQGGRLQDAHVLRPCEQALRIFSEALITPIPGPLQLV